MDIQSTNKPPAFLKSLKRQLLFLILLFPLTAFSQAWYENTSIYQIYPRSYQDSDGDGVGDLKGIISRLDYIKNLGVETIWISPFYPSPQEDFGYDISDYQGISPEYGNLEIAQQLIDEVHKRDMKIIFDMVLNHTSDQHPWFLESKSSRDNPKSDWYVWHNGIPKKATKEGKPPSRQPNNWQNVFNKKAWRYFPERDQWLYTAFLDFQPDLNWRNPEVKEAMWNNVRFWLDRGVDGFRLDIFNCILEDPALTKNPFSLNPAPSKDGKRGLFQKKVHNINHPDNFKLAAELRQVLEEYDSPDRFVVGEVFGDLPTLRKYLGRIGKQEIKGAKGLNLVFLFDMIYFDFKASFFRKMVEEFEQHFEYPYMPTLVYGNHDNFRSIRRVKNRIDKARVLAMFQLTARGIPVIYYGEEIGMTNPKIPKKEALDPISWEFNGIGQALRNLLPVPLNRDVCRTPMQWNAKSGAGFTDPGAKSWLPVSEDRIIRNVFYQEDEPASLLNTYRRLLAFRNDNPSLQKGSIQILDNPIVPGNVLAFTRQNEGKSFLVLINYSGKNLRFEHPAPLQKELLRLNEADSYDENKITLSPFGGLIIEIPPQ